MHCRLCFQNAIQGRITVHELGHAVDEAFGLLIVGHLQEVLPRFGHHFVSCFFHIGYRTCGEEEKALLTLRLYRSSLALC